MDLFTVFGLIMGLVFAFFLPVMMEADRERSRNVPRFQDRTTRSRRGPRPRRREQTVNTPGMQVNRIEGEICWRSGRRRSECSCRSCR
jgi:hypothetical protein